MDANRFAELLEDLDLDVTTDYSGRGMYGKKCVGFTVDDDREVHRAIIDLLVGCDDDEREDLGKILRGGRVDSMGRSTIFYFPRVSVEVAANAVEYAESSEVTL